MSARLLLVEDDLGLRLGLTASLRAAGHQVVAVASAEEADAAVRDGAPDLVVLDWGLPGMSGLELLEGWRARGVGLPVIFLTARDEVRDRVRGLEAGADDYLTKPFATEELLARIAVRLRGVAARAGRVLELAGGVVVDLARGEVVRDGAREALTTHEAGLLAYLDRRAGEAVSRDDLLREVWGYRAGVVSRAVDNTVARLRAKIECDPAAPRHVLTVHGIGYRFVA